MIRCRKSEKVSRRAAPPSPRTTPAAAQRSRSSASTPGDHAAPRVATAIALGRPDDDLRAHPACGRGDDDARTGRVDRGLLVDGNPRAATTDARPAPAAPGGSPRSAACSAHEHPARASAAEPRPGLGCGQHPQSSKPNCGPVHRGARTGQLDLWSGPPPPCRPWRSGSRSPSARRLCRPRPRWTASPARGDRPLAPVPRDQRRQRRGEEPEHQPPLRPDAPNPAISSSSTATRSAGSAAAR